MPDLSISKKNITSQIKEAKSPHISDDAIAELVNSDNKDVLIALAENKKLPINYAYILLNKHINYVDQSLAENNFKDYEIYEKLATHEKWYVRMAIAENANVPDYILNYIIENDDYPEIRIAAEETLNKKI